MLYLAASWAGQRVDRIIFGLAWPAYHSLGTSMTLDIFVVRYHTIQNFYVGWRKLVNIPWKYNQIAQFSNNGLACFFNNLFWNIRILISYRHQAIFTKYGEMDSKLSQSGMDFPLNLTQVSAHSLPLKYTSRVSWHWAQFWMQASSKVMELPEFWLTTEMKTKKHNAAAVVFLNDFIIFLIRGKTVWNNIL